MPKNYLLIYAEQLATDIELLCRNIKAPSNTLFQLRKSSSSIYANIREANYGHSRADMISKFEISLKECSETEGWLKLLFNTNIIDEPIYKKHRNLCGRIRRMLISSCKTLKEQKPTGVYKMNKFCVIFDMDGTLLDTQRIYIDAWDLCGEHQGFPNLGRHIAAVCGMNEIGWINFLVEHYPSIDLGTFRKEVADYVTAHLEVTFMPGARETLEFLKQAGVPIAVASGTDTATVRAHMKKLNAAHYFDAFIGGEQVQNGKPAPDIFLKAAEELGFEPKDCFVVEDSANGVRAGYAAGMRCIGIPDIAIFDEEVQKMLFAKLTDLSQTIPLFEKELNK